MRSGLFLFNMDDNTTQIENPVILSNGKEVYSYGYIEKLRKEDSQYNIIAQAGSQEKFLLSDADIVIFGGKRGGSKSFSLLLEALKDIYNPKFAAAILRKEKDDSRKVGGIVDVSAQIYSQFGIYNKSQQDMTWNFHAGGRLKFDYYSDSFEDFKKRFQGGGISYIGVDEITHMEYAYAKYLITCNRNAHHIRNRFYGTCNPDPDSWVAKFIDWWIDEEGYPMPERNGVVRYCFMYGESVEEIYWGNTRKEVYEQAKDRIDKLWKKEYEEFGDKETMFVKSVTFIEGKLEENKKLLKSDPSYLANLANQDEEQVARDLMGNWKFKSAGTGLITLEHMEAFFHNTHQKEGLRCVTCDPALEGGDNCVFWYWEGYHAKDLKVCKKDSKITIQTAKSFLELHNVLEENFAYDVNGLGQIFTGFFPNAKKFNNVETPSNGDRTMFENLKAECAYRFIELFKSGGVSIEPFLLGQKYSGKRYKNVMLKNILMTERKAMRQDDSVIDKYWALVKKPEMIKICGHSPDFWESFFMRYYFEICKKQKTRTGTWRI